MRERSREREREGERGREREREGGYVGLHYVERGGERWERGPSLYYIERGERERDCVRWYYVERERARGVTERERES